VQDEAVVETNHEMFSDWLDSADGRSRQSFERIWSRRQHTLAFQGRPEHGRHPVDRVAFGHPITP
jgi:hypothetical protein